MVRLEESKYLGRKIRQDPWDEIGISTWTKIKEAIVEGKNQEALELLDYLSIEGKSVHDIYVDWVYFMETFIADRLGEEEMYRVLRETANMFRKSNILRSAEIPVVELVTINAESMRAHRSGPGEMGNIRVIEKKDRYLMYFDPCGSGGRVRRTGEIDKTPPRTGPPYNLGRTKKAWPWSWGKIGVPYYCTHCCAWSEIMSVELNGYPVKVTLYNDDPEIPCGWAFYKNPELIPNEYFSRIGKEKDLSRFRKLGSSPSLSMKQGTA